MTEMSKLPESPESNEKRLPAQMQDWEGSSAYVEQGRHWSSALIWLCSVLLVGPCFGHLPLGSIRQSPCGVVWSLLAQCAMLNRLVLASLARFL